MIRRLFFATLLSGCATAAMPEEPAASGSPAPPENATRSTEQSRLTIDPAGPCRAACAQLGEGDCVTAAERDRCTALCDDSAGRDAFVSCAAGRAQCDALDCYAQFNPAAPTGATPAEAMRCRQECDQLAQMGCIAPLDQSLCRDRCADDVRATVRSFDACVDTAADDCTAAAACERAL
jgi:hypothetical protein